MRYSLILITTLLAGSLVCCKKDSKKGLPEERPVDVAYPMVDSVTLYKTYPGYISANSKVDVVGRVNGQLLSKNFNDGDYVQKGQVLFVIESSTYRDAVNKAAGELATAKSEYEYASKNYAAMNLALKEDAVSEISVVQAESAMRQAQAAIRSAQASLETANTNLGYCTVRAPISGHITSGNVNVGEYINGAGAPVTLTTIYDDSSFCANFSIEENQYDLLLNDGSDTNKALYRSIPLVFKEKLGHDYTADLNYSSPTVDQSTGTISLRAKVEDPYGELRNGMYVTVRLPYGTNPKAVLIPDASIGTDQLGKYVYLVNDSNKVVYTPIEVGELYNDSLRIVNKGIGAKDRYVTKALLTVRNGEKVKPVVTK